MVAQPQIPTGTPQDRMDAAASRAERALLAALLFDRDVLPLLTPLVSAADFLILAHRQVWDAAVSLHRRRLAPDLVTISHQLAIDGAIWDATHLSGCCVELLDGGGSPCHALTYAGLVRDHAERRRKQAAGLRLIDEAYRGDATPLPPPTPLYVTDRPDN